MKKREAYATPQELRDGVAELLAHAALVVTEHCKRLQAARDFEERLLLAEIKAYYLRNSIKLAAGLMPLCDGLGEYYLVA